MNTGILITVPPAPDVSTTPTGRQLEMLAQLAQGRMYAGGAYALGMPLSVFRNGINQLNERMGTVSTAYAVKRCYERGLFRLDGVPPQVPDPMLSAEQQRLLELIGEGLTDQQITRKLGMTYGQINGRMRRMYKDMGVQNRPHAVHVGYATGNLRLTVPEPGMWGPA